MGLFNRAKSPAATDARSDKRTSVVSLGTSPSGASKSPSAAGPPAPAPAQPWKGWTGMQPNCGDAEWLQKHGSTASCPPVPAPNRQSAPAEGPTPPRTSRWGWSASPSRGRASSPQPKAQPTDKSTSPTSAARGAEKPSNKQSRGRAGKAQGELASRVRNATEDPETLWRSRHAPGTLKPASSTPLPAPPHASRASTGLIASAYSLPTQPGSIASARNAPGAGDLAGWPAQPPHTLGQAQLSGITRSRPVQALAGASTPSLGSMSTPWGPSYQNASGTTPQSRAPAGAPSTRPNWADPADEPRSARSDAQPPPEQHGSPHSAAALAEGLPEAPSGSWGPAGVQERASSASQSGAGLLGWSGGRAAMPPLEGSASMGARLLAKQSSKRKQVLPEPHITLPKANCIAAIDKLALDLSGRTCGSPQSSHRGGGAGRPMIQLDEYNSLTVRDSSSVRSGLSEAKQRGSWYAIGDSDNEFSAPSISFRGQQSSSAAGPRFQDQRHSTQTSSAPASTSNQQRLSSSPLSPSGDAFRDHSSPAGTLYGCRGGAQGNTAVPMTAPLTAAADRGSTKPGASATTAGTDLVPHLQAFGSEGATTRRVLQTVELLEAFPNGEERVKRITLGEDHQAIAVVYKRSATQDHIDSSRHSNAAPRRGSDGAVRQGQTGHNAALESAFYLSSSDSVNVLPKPGANAVVPAQASSTLPTARGPGRCPLPAAADGLLDVKSLCCQPPRCHPSAPPASTAQQQRQRARQRLMSHPVEFTLV